MAVCGAYAIRPYTDRQKPGWFLVHFYPMNQKSDWDWIHPNTGVVVCGAYSIRPYTGDLKNGDFSICSTTGVAVRRAYAIRLYPAGRKFIGFFGSFLSRESKIGSELISFGL